MANYCSNSVIFLGDSTATASIKDLFTEIELKQKQTSLYYLPDFITDEKGYVLDITFDGDWISYESRWVPNLDLLVQLADRYAVDFISHFDELSNGMYGEAVYRNHELKTVYRDAWEDERLSDDPELSASREEQKLMLESYAQLRYNPYQR